MGIISESFWTREQDFSIQRCDDMWMLYDENGDFVNAFKTFERLYEVMNEIRRVKR